MKNTLPAEQNKDPKICKSEKTQESTKQLRSQIDEVLKQKEQAEKKAAEYLEKLQRLQADMENFQKITKRQIDTVTKQASERLLIKLLPILDALNQAGMITHTDNAMPPEEISVGLKMLTKQLIEVLGTEGLEGVPAVGQPLNPEMHEAVGYVETDDAQENTVMEEVRKGYLLNGKVIRPSLVVVSKPKPPSDQKADEPESEPSP